LGKIFLMDASSLARSVTLRNTGSSPVCIEDVAPSCGCTSAILDRKGAHTGSPGINLPFVLDPGQSIALAVKIDTTRLSAGLVRKTVFIHTDGDDLCIALAASAIGPVKFNVDDVDFGAVQAGKRASKRIDVLLDPRVASIPFHIVSDDPNVLVTAVKPAALLRRQFDISLSAIPRLGPLDVMLTLVPDVNAKAADRMYESTFLPVNGSVFANIDASPTEAVFGLVKAGQPAKICVNLVGKGLAQGAVRALATEKYIRATVSKTRMDGSGRMSASLDIVLTAAAPAGQIASRVVVMSGSGTEFSIPVLATVSRFASGN